MDAPHGRPGHDLLRPGEAARLLGVGVSTVTRWAEAGHLPTVRLAGSHRRYRRTDVERYLARRHEPRRDVSR